MKKIFSLLLSFFCAMFLFVGCSSGPKAIELMGAGDRIHDTFTFANVGTKLEEKSKNVYRIYGSVEKLENEEVKREFEIDSDIDYVVAIKLSAQGKEVIKNKVQISVDGIRSYDAEHLNGSDYTFIILEVVKNGTVTINVSWNGEDNESYLIEFDEGIELK